MPNNSDMESKASYKTRGDERERYPARITVRITEVIKLYLEREARMRHLTVGDIVREILRKQVYK